MASAAKTDFDTSIMKIVSAFAVVLIHSLGEYDRASIVLNCICRFCVPVFVIISGRYMLRGDRKVDYFAKKCGRFLLLMLCWSAIYYVYYTAIGSKPRQTFPVFLLTQPVHLWYLWMIAGLCLLAPLLAVFAKAAPKNVYIYALIVMAVLGSPIFIMLRADVFPLLSTVAEKTKLPTQLGFIFLFLLGDYLHRYEPKVSVAAWVALFAVGTAFTVAGTLHFYSVGEHRDLLLSFFAPGAMAAGIGFYGACEKLFRGAKASAALNRLASDMLGVYLVHFLIINVVRGLWAHTGRASDVLSCVLIAVVTFGISAVISRLLSKIPVLKFLVK